MKRDRLRTLTGPVTGALMVLSGVAGAVALSTFRGQTLSTLVLPSLTIASLVIGVVVIAAGILGRGGESRFQSDQRLDTIIGKRIGIVEQSARVGVVECCDDCSIFNHTPIIHEAHDLTVLLNDGRTWTSVHRDRLRHRFRDPSKSTTVFLIHPTSSMLEVLARKGSVDVSVLRARILETVATLEELSEPVTRLEVLGHHLFNPHSMVLSEARALVIPYMSSRGRRRVPLFVFEDVGEDCFFRQLVIDMEGLRMDSELLARFPKGREDLSHPTRTLSGGRSERQEGAGPAAGAIGGTWDFRDERRDERSTAH